MNVFLVVLTAVAAGAALAGGAVWFLRRVWFYRDPVRVPPDDPAAILAPADGKLIYARRFEGGEVVSEKLGKRIPITEITRTDFAAQDSGWIIGVYMTPLDVHYNYAPVAGVVSRVVHTPAAVNLPMLDLWEYVKITYLRRAIDLFGRKYHLSNERNTIFIDVDRDEDRANARGARRIMLGASGTEGAGATPGEHGTSGTLCMPGMAGMAGTTGMAGAPEGGVFKVAVVEIADKFVNKIRCFVKEGDRIRAGQKLSFIERGSQVDLVIPGDNVEIVAKVGQQIYGGSTVIARFRNRDEDRTTQGLGCFRDCPKSDTGCVICAVRNTHRTSVLR